MSTKKKIIIVTITVVGLVVICSSTAMIFYLSCPDREGREPIPQAITLSRISPDNTRTAVLFSSNTGNPLDWLGAGERAYLGIQYEHATYIVTRDLTEGSGTYEGGVLDVRWLDPERILVERIISDRQNDIVFDLSTHMWSSQ